MINVRTIENLRISEIHIKAYLSNLLNKKKKAESEKNMQENSILIQLFTYP
jgi:hypothetical protein